jgi:hypothetical protein
LQFEPNSCRQTIETAGSKTAASANASVQLRDDELSIPSSHAHISYPRMAASIEARKFIGFPQNWVGFGKNEQHAVVEEGNEVGEITKVAAGGNLCAANTWAPG